jgi:hypothetical protein
MLILMIVTGFICSCNRSNEYVIQGNVTGFPDSTMIYLRNMSTDETFDSALIVKNHFELKGILQDVPEQLWLNTTINNKFIYTDLLIKKNEIKIST